MRKRPKWLKAAENKVYGPKRTQTEGDAGGSEDAGMDADELAEIDAAIIDVTVTSDLSDVTTTTTSSQLENFELLRQRQQDQMEALLRQGSQVRCLL